MAGVILIVEDEPAHRLLIRKALEENGNSNSIFEVENGRKAIAYVYGEGIYANRETWPMPDLILLDIKMPEMNGFEVLTRLKNDPDTKSIPIIMLTTSAREEEITKSYQAGANAHVIKPLGFEDFSKKFDAINLFRSVIAEKSPRERRTE